MFFLIPTVAVDNKPATFISCNSVGTPCKLPTAHAAQKICGITLRTFAPACDVQFRKRQLAK